jgi:cyanophycinase-like exopeptidase
MVNRTLKVIPKPEEGSRTVLGLAHDPDTTVIIESYGQLDLLCGNCAAVLAHKVIHAQIKNLVLYCKRCGSYNETPQ